MEYNTFLETIQSLLKETITENCTIALHSIPKNNGQLLDGISIHYSEESLAPTIYLNPYYERFQEGMSLEDILADIMQLLDNNPTPVCINADQISQFSFVQDKIMFKVIHAASNKQLLQDLPHLMHLDLAIVFYLFIDQSATGQMTALVHNDHQRMWNVSTQTLFDLALKNTPAAFPATIKSMEHVLKEIACEHLGEQYDESMMDLMFHEVDAPMPLYVLSNPIGINGACCMFYPDILKKFADFLDHDLIILPSSIHEILITPDLLHNTYEDFGEMVTFINQNEVPIEDRLSNQVYLYDRKQAALQIVTQSSEQVTLPAADCSRYQ